MKLVPVKHIIFVLGTSRSDDLKRTLSTVGVLLELSWEIIASLLSFSFYVATRTSHSTHVFK